ncbi:MAG: aconitase family protein, partial [Bacteroidota bacterium]
PNNMLIEFNGKLGKGVTAKDVVHYIIYKLTAAGGTGYFVDYGGTAIRSLSMEGRMTVCNMSIEMGARGGMIAPDETTFDYLKDREHAPQGEAWDQAVTYWQSLVADTDASYDRIERFNAADIEPMITYGTNPGMGIKISEPIPSNGEVADLEKALKYMNLEEGAHLKNHPIDYVFIGSCTNSRIEDLREVADFVKGKKKAQDTEVWIVPGSKAVEVQAREEGLDTIFAEAGFDLREPGCSACLGMNEDKVPAGKYCVSTSNRNFEGRQGPGARTFLVSPIMAAAAAVTGKITDVRELI